MPEESGEATHSTDERLDRAVRLFEFLSRVQQVKQKTPRTFEAYERDGEVIWFHRLPSHEAVRPAPNRGEDGTAPVLVVDRVPRHHPPEPPELVRPWVDEYESPDSPPSLRSERITEGPADQNGYAEVLTDRLAENPAVTTAFEEWLPSWQQWADVERSAAPVRDLYGRLFSVHVQSMNQPEELELVLGVAALGWKPDEKGDVRRHLLTAPAAVDFDDTDGRLSVVPTEAMDTLSVELDMLDPALVKDAQRLSEIRDVARELDTSPLDRDEVSLLGRRLVHSLDPDGKYEDDDAPPSAREDAVVTYAPALILRRRSRQNLIHVFEDIVAQLREAGEVPEGLCPLVDPNHVPDPGLEWDGTGGALIDIGDETFLPLPVNDRQLQVIRRVDTTAQTLVQGPPGTGKTHTAAALIAHLLAQGKRVLVTAQTDRALKEVRGKLPEPIQPLSVAVVGAAREDMADLKVAVERIAVASAEHDDASRQRELDRHLEAIDSLRSERASVHRRLIEARESETRTYERPEITGTLAAIAQRYEAESERFAWLLALESPGADAAPPLTNADLARLRALLCDEAVLRDEAEAGQSLIDPNETTRNDANQVVRHYLSPETLAEKIAAESAAKGRDANFEDVHGHEAFTAFLALDAETRHRHQSELHRLADVAESLARRDEAWMGDAMADIQRGRAAPWKARRSQIAQLIDTAEPLIGQLGPVTTVTCDRDAGPLTALAGSLRKHLADGGKLKVDASGMPKVGALSPRVVKDAATIFDAVRIDGLPPSSVASLDVFLTWVKAEQALDALDRAWPDDVAVPAEDTQSERLHWHVAELEQLDKVLALADDLGREDGELSEHGLQPLNWGDLSEVRLMGRVVDAVSAREALSAATHSIQVASSRLAEDARDRSAAQCVGDLYRAIEARDTDAYGTAWDRNSELLGVRTLVADRNSLAASLSQGAPALHALLRSDPTDSKWDRRVEDSEAAWRWASTGSWIREREEIDVNLLQRQLDATENSIRSHVEEVAAIRAWRHAVSEDRLTGEARANLTQYAQLVQRLGKGTGKYAAQRRAEIRDAMDRCRPSVPVWILPIYRIAEQLRVSPDMFDVIVVDEASQAGLEASFLQYLAPKMVVIGDDKQVSPAAVGVDQQQLRDLANQYLYDDRYIASWQDPQRSLFDEAKMRYGGLITLVEHRRCVPEIIGFSNRFAYEPEGIRLVPVRQYGADRLEPIKPVFVEGGFTRGTTNKINPVEIDAVIDQIEKCLADPAYDGLTFGVISLLGPAQAKQIEKELLDRLSPEEWAARDLRCGDSAAFQGSERDVMFLSMVAAPEPDKRLYALTQQMYLQRYNVAASRAKDQMWVFHSVPLAELSHPDDLRFQLLDYCYGALKRSTDGSVGVEGPVPEDVKVSPFDSLFEQRVFNRVHDRGYTVIPQYEVEGYRIDLVVLGPKSKVAIECDGDAWHGPDRYEADLARKRDLERCGWTFFNIRESLFYVERAEALAPLWDLLEDMAIHPSGWEPPPSVPEDPAPVEETDPRSGPEPPDIEADTTLEVERSAEEHLLETPVGGEPKAQPETTAQTATAIGQTSLDDAADLLPAGEADATSSEPASIRETDTDDPMPGSSRGLAPYVEYTGSASAALQVSRSQLIEELVEIVTVEGPVLGERMQRAHVKAARGQRVGRQIAKALNSAIHAAVRQGLLVTDNPLEESGVKPLTYRLADQPLARVRDLGPRTLDLVPPLELAEVLTGCSEGTGWEEEELLFRAVLDQYGLRRLTTNTTNRLRQIVPLCE